MFNVAHVRILLCFVSLVMFVKSGCCLEVNPNLQVLGSRHLKEVNDSYISAVRSKRQNNPCTEYYQFVRPPVPNFSASGRRVSEKKCFEYIWNLKERILAAERKQKCLDYTKANNLYFPVPHVIGGYIAQKGEFPHMAAVGWLTANGSYVYKCGSALISERFALTAAHCTKASAIDTSIADKVPKVIRIADNDILDLHYEKSGILKSWAHEEKIAEIISHPKYSPPKKYYDIALLKLGRNFEFSRDSQPACLWTKPDTSPLGSVAIVTGWGVVKPSELKTSPNLMAAEVDLLDTESCNRLLRVCNRNICGVEDTQLCAGKLAGGVDTCQGDSGGPLQVKINIPDKTQGTMSYLIGITSFGKNCARANSPGIYTRVSTFIDWIEPIVWPGETFFVNNGCCRKDITNVQNLGSHNLVQNDSFISTVRFNRQSDPCAKFDPPVPDFSAPGRRISEKKCFEYIWNVKKRILKTQKHKECEDYIRSQNKIPSVPFVAGGYIAQRGEFPHMAAVGWTAFNGSWVFKCGSALISERFALTAAHCTKASAKDTSITDPVPKIIRIADNNILDKYFEGGGIFPHDKKIAEIISHPKYAPPMKYYDIALLKLESDVEFSRDSQPACLWTNPDTSPLGSIAIVTGWGVVKSGGLQTSPDLIAAEVDLIDTESCNRLLRVCNRNICGVKDSQLCAGKLAGGVDTCQGDSGGPLQVKLDFPDKSEGTMSYLIGITSFGKNCARSNSPGIYTRVSTFIDWIEPIVWPGEKSS